MRILVIEDDDKIQSFIGRGLSQEGHTIDKASTGDEGLSQWMKLQYDAVVLDIMLPGKNGIEILKQMRRKGDQTPVLILSAKNAVDDRVTGLETGADDYMAKPFSFSELAARLHAITRRIQPAAQGGKDQTTLKLSGVVIDLLRRSVVRDNTKIDLQPREFALLELLMRNPNRPLNKTVILERIWDYSFDPQTNVVDVLICRLRTKLDSGFKNKLIQTIRGVGYVFRSEE